MSRRIAVEVFEAIPARRERPSSAGGGGSVVESPPPRCFRSSRAEPPKAFPPHATWPIPQDVWTFGGIRCAGSALRSVSLEHVRVRVVLAGAALGEAELQGQAVWRVGGRSEERRAGRECVRTCKSRWSPNH